ncbi:CAP domain-containing protein [Crocinitomicaceae bacterium]|nr:CAP domain-containing protein [Crocinitomicaceae bacterium]
MKKIIIAILFTTVSFLSFSQSLDFDKKHSKYLEKIESLYGSNNYYKLYKTTKKALNSYPDDKWFNYMFSYALYYSRDHEKIRKKFNNSDLLMSVLDHLDKTKPIEKNNNSKFSKDLQNELYSKSKKVWDNKEFSESLPFVDFLLKHYDNSSNVYQNIFSENIQDELFILGKELYLSDKKEDEAQEIFNWILATYYQSNFTFKYNGAIGYTNSKYTFEEYKNPLYYLANTAKNTAYLSQEEKELIYLQNLVRMNPKLFNDTYVKTYYKLNPKKSNSSYAKSLVKDLKESGKIQVLYPKLAIFDAAEFHANDLGKLGKTGHESTDGATFSERLKRYGVSGYIAENCSYGHNEALDILMQLLIDENVESLGHRKNIMNGVYSKVGLAIRPHKKYRNNAVLDYQK